MVFTLSPRFTVTFSRLEYTVKYSPWRKITTVLAPVSLVTLATSPSKTARAKAPSVVAMSMPLLVTVTLSDTTDVCFPYDEEITPRSTGQGSLPLLLTKLVDRVFSAGVKAMPFSLVAGVVVLPFVFSSSLRFRSASSLALRISSAMMSSMAFCSFLACCCLSLMSCCIFPSCFLSFAT